MMTVLTWLAYCLIIAGVLAAAAGAWETSARWSGRPVRWAWMGALAGSVTLPWLLRLLPEQTVLPAIPMTVPMLTLDPLVVGAGAASAGWSAVEVALAAWAVLSVVAAAYVVYLLIHLGRARRGWRQTELDGQRIYVTRNTGPAALGVREPVVVIPAWALALEADLRGLLLQHEREHVSAGDPKLLLAGLVLVAAMPWNPVLWLQVIRLRNAIELDCDGRVLARGADPERYGSLLLEVGRRRGGSSLVMATFAEPRLFLRERISRIAKWPHERRPGRAWLFSAIALALCATALSARDPLRARVGAGAADALSNTKSGVMSDATSGAISSPSVAAERAVLPADTPVFTPMTVAPELQNRDEVRTALEQSYPPMLRDAGIGGRPTVWFHIDPDGVVQAARLSKPSGHPALDEAALSVAKMMRFSPALNVDRRVAVWVELPIIFAPPGAATRPTITGREPAQRTAPADPAEAVAPVQPAGRVEPRTPPTPETEAAVRAGPVFTPMTVAPDLTNRDVVAQALQQHYPPMLRDAGIGGRPTAWFYIDATGTVQQVRLEKSSGHPALDEAALRVGQLMQFTPARNRDKPVAVWVELPIIFTAR
jgi:TonB family protein